MSHSVSRVERSLFDQNEIRTALETDFPYLVKHPQVIAALVKWQEWYIGELSDEVDPNTYDAFSVTPVEELYARTERFETGYLPVGIFCVQSIEFDISVKTNGESGLYFWKRDDQSPPMIIRVEFDDLLKMLINSPDNLPSVLEELSRSW